MKYTFPCMPPTALHWAAHAYWVSCSFSPLCIQLVAVVQCLATHMHMRGSSGRHCMLASSVDVQLLQVGAI